ncbi:unnamed protein product [Peronospora destructor]|uniref:Amidohydrolase-related domain-containing protein n=1 Tax=Peronospora destructor TaxID=86335 RepID=A0AAV0V0Z7_9STRA|nr:unnamed protein product [Peronospora destructor]
MLRQDVDDVTDENVVTSYMVVPWKEAHCHFDSVLEWVDTLNAWYRSHVRDWFEHPTWSEDRSSRGGNELLKYVLPDYSGSVVMGRHLVAMGMPIPLPDAIASQLSENGIRRVIIGHTPHGNCPTVIKQPTRYLCKRS